MELHSVTLLHLYYFQRVARLGSVTRAAAELHIAQPALSKHIARLEASLDVVLFHRSRRGVQLAEAGRVLLEHVERMLEHWAQANDEMQRFGVHERQTLSIGTTASFSYFVLPDIVASFAREHPQLELRLQVGHSEEIVQWVLDHVLHGGVVTGPIVDSRLEQTPLGFQELVLAVPPSHPWAARERVPFEALGEVPLIVPTKGRWHRLHVAPLCRARGIRLNICAEVGVYSVLGQLVGTGQGVGLVPETALPGLGPGLRRVRLVDPTPVREVSWIQCKARNLPGYVAVFLRYLSKSLKVAAGASRSAG